MTITTELWDRFGRLDAGDLPADVDTVARQCVLDWFACAMAGTGRRTGVLQAALVNGAAGHAFDFGDAGHAPAHDASACRGASRGRQHER
jgi:2-methylcitrate dehydratase PrpD